MPGFGRGAPGTPPGVREGILPGDGAPGRMPEPPVNGLFPGRGAGCLGAAKGLFPGRGAVGLGTGPDGRGAGFGPGVTAGPDLAAGAWTGLGAGRGAGFGAGAGAGLAAGAGLGLGRPIDPGEGIAPPGAGAAGLGAGLGPLTDGGGVGRGRELGDDLPPLSAFIWSRNLFATGASIDDEADFTYSPMS